MVVSLSLFGGGEGNRTPVRNPIRQTSPGAVCIKSIPLGRALQTGPRPPVASSILSGGKA